MLAFLRKNAWNILATVLAALAIFTGYDIYRRSKPVKAMNILIDSSLSLVEVRPEAASDIEVRYKGKVVNNATLIQVRVQNSGNQPILEGDYSRHLIFEFDPKAEIADATVINSEPPNIGMAISKTGQNRVEANSVLLNPGDTITIRFVVIGPSDPIKIDGRIAGVNSIDIIKTAEQQQQNGTSDRLSPIIVIFATFIAKIIYDFIRYRFFENKEGQPRDTTGP